MAKYQVTGYASELHPGAPHIKYGDTLCITHHSSEVSKDIEVLAWKSRMAKGEVAYIEVMDLVPPFKCQRIYPNENRSG